ncbi:hypothetical protein OHR68_19680 [Spirillospora sp. NBC_00431]
MARLMRFVPRSVMVGFVNTLAILIFLAQVSELRDVPWPVYPLLAARLVLMILFSRITKAVPAPLVSIVILTVITVAAGIALPTVGGNDAQPSSLPTWASRTSPSPWVPSPPIAPYAQAFALVGLMESLKTARSWSRSANTRLGRDGVKSSGTASLFDQPSPALTAPELAADRLPRRQVPSGCAVGRRPPPRSPLDAHISGPVQMRRGPLWPRAIDRVTLLEPRRRVSEVQPLISMSLLRRRGPGGWTPQSLL